MELTRTVTHLPDTIEGLAEFILVGEEAVRAQQAKIRAINKVGMAETARRAAVQDGQDMAKVVIYAEVKLGELLKAIPKKKAASGGGSRSLPKGITHKTSHKAQTIADNPEIVQAAIDAAIKADTLPTTAQVYKLAKKKEALAKVESIRSKRAENPDGKYDVIVIDPPWPMEKIVCFL